MKYLEGMDQIDPSLRLRVMKEMAEYDPSEYTARDVQRALEQETCSVEDLKALLSPAAEPFLEQMARRANRVTSRHFGNSVNISRRCTSPTTARTTAYTADSTATTTFGD